MFLRLKSDLKLMHDNPWNPTPERNGVLVMSWRRAGLRKNSPVVRAKQKNVNIGSLNRC